MDFTILKSTDCTKYIEKKGKFSYLSWPYMVEQLRTHMPLATIQARKNSTGMPYFKDESGAMVETYILEGETELWSEWLPVMNFKNQSITNPNSMDINKAIQRCKAKCISEYLGIGLYIYMGEDLPERSDGTVPPGEPDKEYQKGLPEIISQEEYLSKMKGFAQFEPEAYKKVLDSWRISSAKAVTNKESQVGILNEITAEITA